jgi:hypothetical protein
MSKFTFTFVRRFADTTFDAAASNYRINVLSIKKVLIWILTIS